MDKITKAFVIGACSVVILIGGGQILGRVLGKIGAELEKINEGQRASYSARLQACTAKLSAEFMKDFQGPPDEGWVAQNEAVEEARTQCMRKVTP